MGNKFEKIGVIKSFSKKSLFIPKINQKCGIKALTSLSNIWGDQSRKQHSSLRFFVQSPQFHFDLNTWSPRFTLVDRRPIVPELVGISAPPAGDLPTVYHHVDVVHQVPYHLFLQPVALSASSPLAPRRAISPPGLSRLCVMFSNAAPHTDALNFPFLNGTISGSIVQGTARE
jgi:hypothetical protein